MTLLVLIHCGLAGILVHWYVRFVQKRTASTFYRYLAENKADTVKSVAANIAAIMLIFQTTPELSMSTAVMAYLAGYTIDSKLNRDPNTPTV